MIMNGWQIKDMKEDDQISFNLIPKNYPVQQNHENFCHYPPLSFLLLPLGAHSIRGTLCFASVS
jgi:hypothetical protein